MYDYDAMKQAKLDAGEYMMEGHGLDTRYFDYGDGGSGDDDNGNEKRDETRGKISPGMIGPSHHYQHPYREEIETLEYRPRQLDVSGSTPKDSNEIVQGNKMDDGVWICNEEEDLAQLAMRITNGIENGEIQEMALDLKAHSHRTFAGFVCLIQLSLRRPKSSSPYDESIVVGKSPQPTTSASQPPNISTGYNFLIDALALAIPSIVLFGFTRKLWERNI